MPERFPRVGLALWLLAASPVAAQDADSLWARLDSIGAEYRVTVSTLRDHRRAEARARATRLLEPLDTAVVGPFRIVARERELETAVRYFAAAWSRVAPQLGELRDSVRPHTFLVSVTNPVRVFETMRAGHEDVVWLRSWRFGRPRAFAPEAAIGRALMEFVPQTVRSWVGGLDLGEPTPWDAVYRALALSPAIPAGECLKGEMQACLDALVVDSGPATPEAWYRPGYLRALALAWMGSAENAEVRACRRGEAAACARLLPEHMIPPPLPQHARAALLRLALERGGRGAFERLAADPSATIAERLEATAGVPLEQLAREWRARALSARPYAYAGVGAAVAATLAWLLVFLWLATRSTRCRAG